MDRYLVFAYTPYEELGGINDLYGSTDDMETAIQTLLHSEQDGHVYDVVSSEIVYFTGSTLYIHENESEWLS